MFVITRNWNFSRVFLLITGLERYGMYRLIIKSVTHAWFTTGFVLHLPVPIFHWFLSCQSPDLKPFSNLSLWISYSVSYYAFLFFSHSTGTHNNTCIGIRCSGNHTIGANVVQGIGILFTCPNKSNNLTCTFATRENSSPQMPIPSPKQGWKCDEREV